MPIAFDFAAIVAVFMLLCAVIDYRSQRIPNWLTVSAALLGLAYNSFAPQGIGPLWALAGFAVGFSLLLLPWLLGGGGMGDVKMLAALGTWLGPLYILPAFGLGAILASFGAIAILCLATATGGVGLTQRKFLTVRAGVGSPSGGDENSRKARRVLPFAVPVALATWLVLAWLLVSGH